MAGDQPRRRPVGRIRKAPVITRHDGNIAEATTSLIVHGGPEPTLVKDLFAGEHPGLLAVGVGSRSEDIPVTTRLGVQPAETALTRHLTAQRCRRQGQIKFAVGARHQTVIGGNYQGGAARQHRQQIGNHPVNGSQLGVVVLAEAELVGDLVDAVVVGVDERFACSDRSPNFDRQRRQGPPSLLTVKPVAANGAFCTTTGC